MFELIAGDADRQVVDRNEGAGADRYTTVFTDETLLVPILVVVVILHSTYIVSLHL